MAGGSSETKKLQTQENVCLVDSSCLESLYFSGNSLEVVHFVAELAFATSVCFNVVLLPCFSRLLFCTLSDCLLLKMNHSYQSFKRLVALLFSNAGHCCCPADTELNASRTSTKIKNKSCL